PLVCVFALTLVAGNVARTALGTLLPESWQIEANRTTSSCSDDRCAAGMTSCGLPESCFVGSPDDMLSKDSSF
ncbi:MAG: hypothetical protein ACR2NU_13185, partial [Aeoliella sp.]